MISSRAEVVDRFVTTACCAFVLLKNSSTHNTNVFSSIITLPLLSTIASLSPSGSVINARSAECSNTNVEISLIFSVLGSGFLGKIPFGVLLICIISQFSSSNNFLNPRQLAPFIVSSTILNLFCLIFSISKKFILNISFICKSIDSIKLLDSPSVSPYFIFVSLVESAILNKFSFLSAFKNVPSLSINFIPFHS